MAKILSIGAGGIVTPVESEGGSSLPVGELGDIMTWGVDGDGLNPGWYASPVWLTVGIPYANESNPGDVMTVVDGTWQAAPPSGGV